MPKSIIAGNLNSCISYLITTVLENFKQIKNSILDGIRNLELFCKVIVQDYENSFEFKFFWPHYVTPVLLFLHAKQGKNVNHGHKNGLSCLKAKAYSNQTNQYITLCDLTIAFTTSTTLFFWLHEKKKMRGGVLCCATNLTKVWGCQG